MKNLIMRAVLCNLLVCTTLFTAARVSAQAPTPPMGWNSWDAYGLTIDEQQFRDNVKVLHDKLLPFGWKYAVIDEGWFFENPEVRKNPDTLRYAIDIYGRYVPVPERFPSAAKNGDLLPVTGLPRSLHEPKLHVTLHSADDAGFKPLADWVHAQGLLFGIHIVHGIPRASVERNLPIEGSGFHAQDAADTSDACPWDPTNWGVKDNAAGQAWYDSLLRQYAAWGVDLLKVDCISHNPYKATEIRMLRRAIDKTGRKMVLSLSPGPTDPANAAEVNRLATMWRISNDVWDVWQAPERKGFPQTIRGQFAHAAEWATVPISAGHYPDLDMLPFGELAPVPGWGKPRHTMLTLDEERTVMTLWALMHSPLILGANLTKLDDATLKLLTNREILRLDREGRIEAFQGQSTEDGKPVDVSGPLLLLQGWMRDGRANDDIGGYYAIFNLDDKPLDFDRSINRMNGAPGGAPAQRERLYDVWAGRSLGKVSRVHVTIPPHGVVLLEER